MSNHSQSSRDTETPECSTELKLLVGAPTFCVLLILLSVAGWTLSGWAPEFSPNHLIHLWWLESIKLIRIVFSMVLAGMIVAICFLITLALGDRVITAWHRLRHSC